MKKSSSKRTGAKRGRRVVPPAPQLHSPNIVKRNGHLVRKANISSNLIGDGGTSATGVTPAQSISQSPLYYDYRYSTPDKFYFPRERAQANSIWRDMYRRDATVAVGTDLYSELPWSNFELQGIEDSGIRKVYEDMFNSLNLVPKMANLTRDYLITGELILHTIFNTTKGIWERVVSHNPDYIRVQGLGLATEQPLLWMKATPEIKRLVNSADPRVRKFLDVLPRDMVSAFRLNKELPLEPLNTTYLPRLNTSQEVRGTSLYTRLFRINMYDDFVTNSSLAVAQRNAAPIRMFKLGDPAGNWMPSTDDLQSFAEMLSLAESDPLAAVITHPHVAVDYVGVSDRALLISREWDVIERIKLLALGISKAFLVGETSFAAAVAGLQALLERLAAFRQLFEREWFHKKLCEPIAKMHEFYERPKSELEHRIKIVKPEDRKLIVPKFKWAKSLEPTQDPAVLGVWRDLADRGILSNRTYAAGSGVDIEVERRNLKEEKDWAEAHAQPQEAGAEAGGPPGPAGGPPAPPLPLPGASQHIRRRGAITAPAESYPNRRWNPYARYGAEIDAPRERLDLHQLQADLEDAAAKDSRIHVDDVLDLVTRARRGRISEDELERHLLPAPAGPDLLVGARA